MKVLNLRLCGFTCYRQDVEIDFSDLELFAITGTNGAGKSSLIDAIIFALYGKVPRPSLDLAGLVSQGSKEMDVELRFAVGSRQYKAWRHIDVKNGKATSKARLYQPVDGDWQACCSGIKETNNKIEEAIGLDYEAFVRCIILPQGAFAEFLHDKAERQDILTRLLDMQILDLMQQEAAERHKIVALEIQQLQARIDEVANSASADQLQKLQQQCDALEGEISAALAKLAQIKQTGGEMQDFEKLLGQWRQLEQEHSRLVPQRAQMSELQSRVAKAKKLLPLFSVLQQYERLTLQARQALQAEEQIRQQGTRLAAEEQQQSAAGAMCEQEHALVPQLEQEIDRLQQVRPLQQQLAEQRATLEQRRREVSQETSRLQEVQKRLRQIRQALAQLRQDGKLCAHIEELEQARQRWHKFQDAPAHLQSLQQRQQAINRLSQATLEIKAMLRHKRQQTDKADAELRQQEKQLRQLERELAKLPGKSALEAQLVRFEEARRMLERKKELEHNLAEATKAQQQDQQAQDRANAELSEGHQRLAQKEKLWQDNNDKYERSKEAYSKALALQGPYQQVCQHVQAAEANAVTLRSRQQLLVEQCEELSRQCAQFRQSEESARSQCEAAKAEWMAAYTQNLAHSLRQHLVVGEACPVCAQKVKKAPTESADAGIDATTLEQRAKQAEKEWKDAARHASEASNSLSSQQSARQEVAAQLGKCEQECQKWQSQLAEIEQRLYECLDSRDYDEAIARLQQTNKKLARQVETCRKNVDEQKLALLQWEKELHTLADRQRSRQQSIEQWRQKADEQAAAIRAAIGDSDIDAERTLCQQQLSVIARCQAEQVQLDKSIATLTAQHQAVAAQVAEIDARLAVAEQEEKTACDTWQQFEQQCRQQFAIDEADVGGALRAGHQEWTRVSQELEQAKMQKAAQEEAARKQEVEQAHLGATEEEIKRQLQQKETESNTLAVAIENMARQLGIVTQGQDVDALLLERRQRKKKAEENYQRALQDKLVLAQRRERWEHEWKRQQQEKAERRQQLDACESDLREAASELKLASVSQILDYKVSPAALADWEQQLAQGEMAWQQLQGRMADCRQRMGDYAHYQLTPAQLQQELARNRLATSQLEQAIAQKQEQRGGVLQNIQRMRQDLQGVDSLHARINELRSVEASRSMLALDLHSDRFPSYVLEYAMQTLAEDGTIQLDLLSSGRYAFGIDKREFIIVDNWHGGEVRSARTLSGGETFLAALALALALAERIYQLANRGGCLAALDSLFIDEGFGTLDDDHLDLVVKALQNLQGSGRTVGIISHLANLNNYMPVRLVVHSDKQGSSVHREMA